MMTNNRQDPPPEESPADPDHGKAVPWVSASELQGEGDHAPQHPLDALDEELMESFPCSDSPSHVSRHV